MFKFIISLVVLLGLVHILSHHSGTITINDKSTYLDDFTIDNGCVHTNDTTYCGTFSITYK